MTLLGKPLFRACIRIVYSELPPTSNKIYFRGTILTRKAREYAEQFSAYVAQQHLAEISEMDPLAIYGLRLKFYFPLLINESFNNSKFPVSRRAKTPYKRIDLNNRIKLLEDCIRDALDIDDSHTFESHHEKHQGLNHPRVEIEVYKCYPEDYGIGEANGWRTER